MDTNSICYCEQSQQCLAQQCSLLTGTPCLTIIASNEWYFFRTLTDTGDWNTYCQVLKNDWRGRRNHLEMCKSFYTSHEVLQIYPGKRIDQWYPLCWNLPCSHLGSKHLLCYCWQRSKAFSKTTDNWSVLQLPSLCSRHKLPYRFTAYTCANESNSRMLP